MNVDERVIYENPAQVFTKITKGLVEWETREGYMSR